MGQAALHHQRVYRRGRFTHVIGIARGGYLEPCVFIKCDGCLVVSSNLKKGAFGARLRVFQPLREESLGDSLSLVRRVYSKG